MNALTFIFGLFALAVLVWVFLRGRSLGGQERMETRFEEFSRALERLTQQLDIRLREAASLAERGQARASDALERVAAKLGEQGEAVKGVAEFQKELKRLQDLLQPPKARGGVGELMLEQLLRDLLPEGDAVGQYEKQHGFKSGERVDFVLRLKDFLVPIDAKFPMEAHGRMRAAETDEERARATREFRQAVKQHIDAVGKKYIHPDEGTADFAFLYIPSEAVYLAFVDDDELVDYAFDRRVIVVSPGTFFAYLRTVLLGLRGFAIEASAKELLKGLGQLEGELTTFAERFRVVGGHLRNAVKAYEDAERQVTKLSDRVTGWLKRV